MRVLVVGLRLGGFLLLFLERLLAGCEERIILELGESPCVLEHEVGDVVHHLAVKQYVHLLEHFFQRVVRNEAQPVLIVQLEGLSE